MKTHSNPSASADGFRSLPSTLRMHGADCRFVTSILLALFGLTLLMASPASRAVSCARTITANVVVLDQPLMFNRLGAQNVNGMIYALRRDVINRNSGLTLTSGGAAIAGQVALRPDKRPRPLVLRVAEGDCLTVNLQNLLTPGANPFNAPFPIGINEQASERKVSFHPQGLELLSINDDGSKVGRNDGVGLVPPNGGTGIYNFYARKRGTFLVTSYGATFSSEGTQGNSANGLFGAVTVEPPGANFYRSQVTEEELRLATTGHTPAAAGTLGGQPILDYEARYPNSGVWAAEGKGSLPILNMLTGTNELVHSDINAIIVGSGQNGRFPASTYPLERAGKRNPSVPNRLDPFREYTVIFHDEAAAGQAFPGFYNTAANGGDNVFRYVLQGVRDSFMINYGSGGIGSEIIASRLGVGPMHDCLSCAYEEFFLTAHAVGDVAILVDTPANFGLENLRPGQAPNPAFTGIKATAAFYPDDPSNVHHSYINDHTVFRNLHVGKEQHVFHLHNHQWLYSADDDNGNYLDAQGIGPGAGYTYEINFGGSGNRNKSAGDAIFHCHFYPHFAQGMWAMWRNHDVFEAGTLLQASGGEAGFHSDPYALQVGRPLPGARALPDGEIVAGTPIPALVPLPGKAMAPMPARVSVEAKLVNGIPVGSVAKVEREIDATLPDLYETACGTKCIELNPGNLKNPGYPFWIAGIEDTTGQRPPTPPLDMDPLAGGWDGGLPRHNLEGIAEAGHNPGAGDLAFTSRETRLDFTKEILKAKAVFYPEGGTDLEKAAMAFHAGIRNHPSYALNLAAAGATPAAFVTNGSGAPGIPGAPYHEPCVDDQGHRLTTGVVGNFFSSGGFDIHNLPSRDTFTADRPRVYKGANIQFDAVFNKAGYHYPQERITALWGDVPAIINKTKPPEPLVMRMNTFDCTMYQHTNLVPHVFEMDDYQVRTPTDIIGQHIHLPKWDLTTTDGSANGWNYEDGTLAPEMVRERIHAINDFGIAASVAGTGSGPDFAKPNADLVAKEHPTLGQGTAGQNWLGARTTLQRWFSDPVVNAAGEHRGLGIIFTHDHYGPSTHQQIGLYATVLNEPPGSTWKHNETGTLMGGRDDGGPTSWQAIIQPGTGWLGDSRPHREFYFEFSDFQHAYEAGVYVGANQSGVRTGGLAGPETFRRAINPPFRQQKSPVFPDLVNESVGIPGSGCPARPCPQAISVQDPGMLVVNYRNEPVGLRVYDPNKIGPDGKRGTQADGLKGDLAFALQSRTDRANTRMNVQPTAATNISGTRFPPPINTGGVTAGDPFTPMLRTYTGDLVRMKVQAGGHEEEHNATIHGVKWLQGGSGYGSSPNSGWRNAQAAGISEQFTFSAPVVPVKGQVGASSDYAWSMDGANDGWWSGNWGLMRAYNTSQSNLPKLPTTVTPVSLANPSQFNGACPTGAPLRNYDVSAVLANTALPNNLGVTIPANTPANGGVRGLGIVVNDNEGAPLDPNGGTLVFNPRAGAASRGGPLHDPTAILYVRTADLDASGRLNTGAPVEPLVLRAAAGDCIQVTLRNRLPAVTPDLPSYTTLIGVVKRDRDGAQGSTTFNKNLIRASSHVGLHPQLVAYDVAGDDGTVVGNNPPSAMVAPGGNKTYRWYAGDLKATPAGNKFTLTATPIEFGGVNLTPADKIKQGAKGLVGSLIIEPANATWVEADQTRDRQSPNASDQRLTRASATVTAGGSSFRDFAVVLQKGMTHRYGNGSPVEHINGEGDGIPEDSQDATHMALNYGTEPLWYRFDKAPNAAFGHAAGAGFGDVANAGEAYGNALAGGEDPATPVFTVDARQPFRMHFVVPHGTTRGSTFHLHGHVWPRAPYITTGYSVGNSVAGLLGSERIGENPLSFYQGGQESVTPYSHWDLVFPSAGGSEGVQG
ncbi:MAG: hypothetical protein H6R26_579, partial [Proteobacteria bacterium]|nr:hypothetical protein [Pseudomonadota bacterium]